MSHYCVLSPVKPATGGTLRPCVSAFFAATERRKHTQVDFLSIYLRGAFEQSLRILINSERLDAIVFTSMLPATKRKSRTCATRATDVIFERKHCSRRRRHTHRSNFRRRENAQTKRRQSHVNAGTVPESENVGT